MRYLLASTLVGLFLVTAVATAQESGMIGRGAPNDVFLYVTTGENGEPILS